MPLPYNNFTDGPVFIFFVLLFRKVCQTFIYNNHSFGIIYKQVEIIMCGNLEKTAMSSCTSAQQSYCTFCHRPSVVNPVALTVVN